MYDTFWKSFGFPQYKMVKNNFFCMFKSRNVNPTPWIIFFNMITIYMYMLVLTFRFINDNSENLIKNNFHKYETYIEVSEIFSKVHYFCEDIRFGTPNS